MIAASFPILPLLAAAGQAPALASGTGPDVSLWRVILALVLCLVLAGAAAWLLRQRMGGARAWPLRAAPAGRLRLIERIALGPQNSAALVAVDGQELLIVSGTSGVAVHPLGPQTPAEPAQ